MNWISRYNLEFGLTENYGLGHLYCNAWQMEFPNFSVEWQTPSVSWYVTSAARDVEYVVRCCFYFPLVDQIVS